MNEVDAGAAAQAREQLDEQPGIEVRDLRVDHVASRQAIVEDVSFTVAPGSVLGIVGESGSGKTTVAMALLGYARPGARIVGGRVDIGGTDIVGLSNVARRRLRGRTTSYVGQDPGGSLNPSMRIGQQMRELLATHYIPLAEVQSRIEDYLGRVALPTDAAFLRRYPHQLSGGQIQRVLLAMALAVDPTLVVLDEPTTALDVKVQRDVLAIIEELKRGRRAALVYVSHDLAVVSEIADHVAVMYGGRIVEQAPTGLLFERPQHPYTAQLLRSIPRMTHERQALQQIPGTAVGVMDRPPGCPFEPRCFVSVDECRAQMPEPTSPEDGHVVRCYNAAAESRRDRPAAPAGGPEQRAERRQELLRVQGLTAWFTSERGLFSRVTHAGPETRHPVVHDVSLAIEDNECLGVVGESGSGKTTLARCIVGLHAQRSGALLLGDDELPHSARDRDRRQQRDIQIVFQNPTASLNPRMTVLQNLDYVVKRLAGIREPRARREKAAELLELVRVPRTMLERYPRELSGGEKQRVAIARALAAKPRLLLCDEITSALDVSVQAAIVGLIAQLREELDDLAVMFISHDLAVVRAVADRIVVMHHGRIVEEGEPETILFAPAADYTRGLIDAIPRLPGD